jgi:hypothetical protein
LTGIDTSNLQKFGRYQHSQMLRLDWY